ncbi:low temperature-induced protein [Bacillus sp. FJAT-27225]|uniref:general stress protein n=1 Tax=Bacillus sp. FJAT-27225 TaxID=1743144 RepID=UPI00080C2B0D|nr:general stress protein [Bacillus sp. FJAT-27225]OCA87692.1 low temperature-induced protein [Bacillus sp. FJAT-27225]
MEKQIIGGVFDSQEEAVLAIETLKAKGFEPNNLSVFAKNDDIVDEIELRTDVEPVDGDKNPTKKIGKGFGIGAGTGGVIGGITGLIAEIGLLAIPGIGPLAAAGPLAATLTGAAVGATGGGIVGALTGAGIPENDAEEYEKFVKEGNILIFAEVEEHQRQDIQNVFLESKTLNRHMYL